MTYLPIIHNSTEVAQLPVYGPLSLTSELMGAKEIQADIELPYAIKPPIGAFITVKGKKYTLNTPPLNVTKQSNTLYKYSLMFEGALYRLYDKGLKHLGNKTFQYYGKPADFAQLIVDNINTIDSGWAVGLCDDLPEIKIDFDKHTCRTALDTIAEKFKIEWNNNEKEISFVKQVGNVTTLVFEYGRGKGLYSLSYAYQSDKNVVTRAFGYGSTRNLPEGYRGGATQLMFDGQYLEKNVFMPDGVTPLYGVKEGDYENEDIYPEIVGTVSAVSTYDPDASTFTITDSSLYFDLDTYFSADTPKVSFLTGELQGQEFEITRYVHATKTITLKVFVDGNNNTLPNSAFQAHVGDTYNLFDMHLPTEVVTAAEERLRIDTQEWLNENCVPRVLYSLELDPLYARDNGIMLNIGDKVRIIDTGLGIDDMIRVTKTVYPINFPEQITPETKISAEIANFIPYTTTERVIAATIDNQKEIKVVDRTNSERARRGSLAMKQLSGRIFDPDGNLAKGEESLFAGMTTVGFESQNFGIPGVTIATNAGADPNALVISPGHLIHYMYEIEGLGYDWTMAGNAWSGLDPTKFYYVYAKCSKTSLAGTWQISETPVFVNDFVGYWAFNLGQLFEVNSEGYRRFDFTKGMTFTVGDTITSGILQDITKQNYFNLNNGSFNLGNNTSGMDYNVTEADTLTIKGRIVATLAEFVNLFVENLRTSATGERIEIKASNKTLTFYSVYDGTERPLLELKGAVDTFRDDDTTHTTRPLAGIEFKKPFSSNPSNPDIVKLTGNGLYANTSGVGAIIGGVGSLSMAFGSIIGYVRRALPLGSEDVHSAIVGLSAIMNAYGGYFKHASSEGISLKVEGNTKLGGLCVNAKSVGNNYQITADDYYVVVTSGSGTYTLYLPTEGLHNGRIIMIKNQMSVGTARIQISISGGTAYIEFGQSMHIIYIDGTWHGM